MLALQSRHRLRVKGASLNTGAGSEVCGSSAQARHDGQKAYNRAVACDAGKKKYLIQLDAPGKQPTLANLKRTLGEVGIDLDEAYGPIPVNRDLGRYVVRGWATADTKSRAEKLPGITFFSDPTIRQAG